MKKKILSVILAIVMFVAIFPASIFYTVSGANNITVKEIVSGLKYDSIGNFSEGLATVTIDGEYSAYTVEKEGKMGFIDRTGKIVIPCDYQNVGDFSEGLAVVAVREKESDNYKYGYIDKTGKIVMPIEYDSAESFKDGLARVKKDGKYGFIDKTGKIVIPLKYDYVWEFSDGLAGVSINDKYGFINKAGEIVIPFEYDGLGSFSEGLAVVVKDGKCGFIDKTGKEIIPFVYDNAKQFSESLAVVLKGDKYGYIDKSGKAITPFKYDDINNFIDGLAVVGAKDGGDYKYGCIDKTGKEVIPLKFDWMYDYFNEGLVVAKIGEKYGFIDKSGKVIIPCEYDYALNFKDGLASTKKDGKWGIIDKTGKVVVPFVYDFTYKFFEGLSIARTGVVGQGTYSIFEIVKTAPAIPSSQKVIVNGMETAFDAYNINGNNYFKLRDLAYVLNGTVKQFEVSWDGKNNAISLTRGKAYTEVGGEMSGKGAGNKTAVPTTSKIYLDGKEINLTAYSIENNNYFKLRDIGEAFDFRVDYDDATKTVSIDIRRPYELDYAVLVEPTLEYESIYGGFNDGLARVIKDGKYGFIDKTGKLVIMCEDYSVSPFSEGLAVAHKNNPNRDENNSDDWGFIDTTGKVVIPIKYDWVGAFHNGRAVFEDNGKYGLLDKTGKITVSATYDSIWTNIDKINWNVSKDGKVGVIDKDGKFIIPMGNKYLQSEGLFSMDSKDENGESKRGFVDINDNWIIPAIYNNAELFHDGLAWVFEYNAEKDTRTEKFIDKTGKVIINITDLGYSYCANYFSDGLCLVQEKASKKFGFIDKTGKLVIPAIYDILEDSIYTFDAPDSFHDGRAIVKKDGKYGIINTKGDIIAPIVYDNIWYFNDNDNNRIYNGFVVVLKNGKCGILDYNTGIEIVPPVYDSVDYNGFSEDGLVVVRNGDKYGIIQVFS